MARGYNPKGVTITEPGPTTPMGESMKMNPPGTLPEKRSPMKPRATPKAKRVGLAALKKKPKVKGGKR